MNKLADQYLETLYAEGLQRSEPIPPIDDPDNAILDLDVRVTQLEATVETLIDQLRQQTLNTLNALRRVGELTAQVAASTAPSASAIILPDRFN